MDKPTVERTKDLNIEDQADLKTKHNCNQCNYSTATTSHLKRHKRIHSGEKLFVCSECKYSFTQASDLKRHLLIHSGEKPFVCSQCKYSCTTAGSLKKTPPHPLRGESFQMQTMQLFLQTSSHPQAAHAHAFG